MGPARLERQKAGMLEAWHGWGWGWPVFCFRSWGTASFNDLWYIYIYIWLFIYGIYIYMWYPLRLCCWGSSNIWDNNSQDFVLFGASIHRIFHRYMVFLNRCATWIFMVKKDDPRREPLHSNGLYYLVMSNSLLWKPWPIEIEVYSYLLIAWWFSMANC